jgi:hypothetical protein
MESARGKRSAATVEKGNMRVRWVGMCGETYRRIPGIDLLLQPVRER